MMNRVLLLCWRLFFLLLVLLVLICNAQQQLPADLFQKAVDFVKHDQKEDPQSTLQQLMDGNIHTLYQVAKSMNPVDPVSSTRMYHYLADSQDHVLSQVALGFAYSENDKPQAIEYFVRAGEHNHQAALYNAGRLYVEILDFPKALAYMRAAATLEGTYSTPELTKTCRDAYLQLSQQIAQLQHLSLQDAADMFLYANIDDFPKEKSKEEKIWGKIMKAMQNENYKEASKHIAKFQTHKKLSDLQVHLLKALQAYTERAVKEEL